MKKIPKEKIKQEVLGLKVRANPKEIKIIGLITEDITANSVVTSMNPYVALKYFQSDWQCFSDWTKDELKSFSDFLQSLKNHTWQQVYNTASKIPKHGLAYTKYKISEVKSDAIKRKLELVRDQISEDIDFFELRVNQEKLRVHGFQSQSVFFLVALDREHAAFPF